MLTHFNQRLQVEMDGNLQRLAGHPGAKYFLYCLFDTGQPFRYCSSTEKAEIIDPIRPDASVSRGT